VTPALLVVVAWLAWLFWGQPPRDTMFWNTLFDAGHAVGFAASTWALERVLHRWTPRLTPDRRAVAAALTACVLAGLTELVQFADPRREPSVGDLLRDMAGIAAYLAFRHWHTHARGRPRVRLALAATLVALAAFAFMPWLRAASAYRQRDAAFPVVVGFEPGWQDMFLTANSATIALVQSEPQAGTPEPTARLILEPGRYPGFSVDELFPDWRGYDRLVVGIQVAGPAPVELMLRIHDGRHSGEERDRFNRRLRLQPGWQVIAIPLRDVAAAPDGRRLDLADVRGVSIFAPALTARAELRLTPLRLE
jgi:hypothetical protein